MIETGIQLETVAFGYGATAFRFDAVLRGNAITAVMGPSGSGKSTLLHLVAGFETPASGRITIGDKDMAGLAPSERPVSMVFQENNLFGHLSVEDNVGLGRSPSLRLSRQDRLDIASALERTGLSGKERRLPRELSGGERQRVALARTLVRQRPVLLLDEPFAALGPALRSDMLGLVAELKAEHGLTVVLVTHQPGDALQIADDILFIEDGQIAAQGSTAFFFGNDGPAAFRHYIGRVDDSSLREGTARKTT